MNNWLLLFLQAPCMQCVTSLPTFETFHFSFDNLIIMCISVAPGEFILLAVHGICGIISFIKLGDFSNIILLNILSASFSLPTPLYIITLLILQRPLRFRSVFFFSFFPSSFSSFSSYFFFSSLCSWSSSFFYSQVLGLEWLHWDDHFLCFKFSH